MVDTVTVRGRAPRISWSPRWAAPFALAWSVLSGPVGVYWALGGHAGYEYGSSFAHARTVGVVLVVGCAGGALAAVAMARRWRRVSWLPAGFGAVMALTLLVFAPGRLLLDVLQLALGVVPDRAGLVFRLWGLIGGLAWGAAAVVHARWVRSACVSCGRRGPGSDVPAAWWRWAITAATVAPLPYSLQRLCWAFGIPFGIPATDLHTIRTMLGGYAVIGLFVLSGLTEAGALLVHGLGRPWGQTYPRWIPVLGGRPVRPRSAVVPGAVAALLLTAMIGVVLQSMFSGESQDPWLENLDSADRMIGNVLLVLLMS
ncbi:MAG: hypothetical protein WCA46_06510, partial [Actinocatenispora sp.]